MMVLSVVVHRAKDVQLVCDVNPTVFFMVFCATFTNLKIRLKAEDDIATVLYLSYNALLLIMLDDVDASTKSVKSIESNHPSVFKLRATI